MSRVKTARKPASRKAFLPLRRRQHKVTQNAHNAAPGRHRNRAPQALVGRPIFVLRLEPRPGVSGIRALRWLLKALSRQHGFRCLDVREDRR